MHIDPAIEHLWKVCYHAHLKQNPGSLCAAAGLAVESRAEAGRVLVPSQPLWLERDSGLPVSCSCCAVSVLPQCDTDQMAAPVACMSAWQGSSASPASPASMGRLDRWW